jgi:uncharacterized protein (TIGR00159 family)
MFRGTNVIRVLIVICLLWFAKQISLTMGLIITSWVLQGIITVAALVIIIVFRNEISSILNTKSLKSFFWGFPQHQFKTPISIIIESVYELARKKIGALIVLPMKQGLESCVQGGVSWQGKLSREMLISIFWLDNPVHDGAAVIQGNRVTDVGVILPLSKRQDLPSYFGTRHRAAVGITEQTDARVIVVSEERGKISLIKESRIYDINDSHVLEKLLEEDLGAESVRTGLRHRALELTAAALICFVSVTGVWLSFSRGFEILASREIPIEFTNLQPKMQINQSSANDVKLLISGSRPLIQAMGLDQIKVKVDVSKAVPGTNIISIEKGNVLLPPGIQLKLVEPSQIEINIDTSKNKLLFVQPAWTGKLNKDIIIESARVVPETVMVTGASLTLKEISTLFTDPIPLDSITESGSISTGFAMGQSGLNLADSTKNSVIVHYQVKNRSNSDVLNLPPEAP